MLRKIFIGLTLFIACSVAAIAGAHSYRMWSADTEIGPTKAPNSQTDIAERVARYVAVEHRGRRVPGEQWFGAAASKRLPEWLRLPVGWIETLLHASDCDSQTRASVYLLARYGIDAHQFDLFGIGITHSLVRARIDGRWVVLDPYTGVLLKRPDGSLLTFEEMQLTPPNQVQVIALRPDGPAFYDSIGPTLRKAVGGQSGTAVYMPVRLDATSLPLTIGRIDGDNDDVDDRTSETGIAARFMGAEFGSGKNSRWTVYTEKPGLQGVLEISFVSDAPPPFPVKGGDCTWDGDTGNNLSCAFSADSDGRAVIDFQFAELRTVYHVDAISVTTP